MFSLESPHRRDSNVCIQYTIIKMKKKIAFKYPKSAAMGFFSEGLKDEFQTAMVNQSSVFEPLNVFCSLV